MSEETQTKAYLEKSARDKRNREAIDRAANDHAAWIKDQEKKH
jgi:hypothetical protein